MARAEDAQPNGKGKIEEVEKGEGETGTGGKKRRRRRKSRRRGGGVVGGENDVERSSSAVGSEKSFILKPLPPNVFLSKIMRVAVRARSMVDRDKGGYSMGIGSRNGT